MIREENVICCKIVCEKKRKVCWPTHYDVRESFVVEIDDAEIDDAVAYGT